MTSKKKIALVASEIKNRQKFLDIYSLFNAWLLQIGFREGHYWNEATSYADYHYSHYDNEINSLNGVELYVHDVLKLQIRFLRDRYEHKMMFVGDMGSFSKIYNINEAKELILIDVRKIRDDQLAKLNPLLKL
jgi:hypothetical protein